MPTIDDCDVNMGSITSLLSGAPDTDYFKFTGNDVIGCAVDPTAQIDVAGVELCVFVACKTAGSTITLNGCTGGTAAQGTPAGTVGCCTQTKTPVTVDYDCSGSDDSANVTLRAKRPAGSSDNTCTPYHVSYHF
ncbi:MAG: hypothetical protein QM702_20975 [Rubrivivax sp.]